MDVISGSIATVGIHLCVSMFYSQSCWNYDNLCLYSNKIYKTKTVIQNIDLLRISADSLPHPHHVTQFNIQYQNYVTHDRSKCKPGRKKSCIYSANKKLFTPALYVIIISTYMSIKGANNRTLIFTLKLILSSVTSFHIYPQISTIWKNL